MIFQKSNFKRAFTLLEIMIAMTIFTVVLVAIYASWAAIVRGAKSGQDAARAAQHARIAIRTIEDALLTTQLYTENLDHYAFLADTSDPNFAWLNLTARLPDTFLGSRYFLDQPVRRVTFFVEADSENVPQLMVSQIPILQVTNSEIQAYSVPLVHDVSLFILEFWDTRLAEWTDELLVTNQIPKMMRVTIGIGKDPRSTSRPAEIVSRVIGMPAVAAQQLSNPTPGANP